MLPIAAPVTAPAVCFGIGGTWISSDRGGLFFFSGLGWLGIRAGSSISSFATKDTSDDKVDVALTNFKMPSGTHLHPATDFESEKHCRLFGTDNETVSVAMRISTTVLRSRQLPARLTF
jgi:hypothetical protein